MIATPLSIHTPNTLKPIFSTPSSVSQTVAAENDVIVTFNPLSTLHFFEASIPTEKSSEKIDMNVTVTRNPLSTPNSANPPVWDSRDETNATVTSTPYFSKPPIPTVKGVEKYL